MCPMAAGKRSIQRRSWRGPSLAKRNPTVAASRLASATDVMPAGNQLLIPTLDRVPLEYHFSGGDASSIRLARTLVELELVSCPRNNETKYACDSSKIWEDRKCVPADPNSP